MASWVSHPIIVGNGSVGWVVCSNCARGPLMNNLHQFVFSEYCPSCGNHMDNPGKSKVENITERENVDNA